MRKSFEVIQTLKGEIDLLRQRIEELDAKIAGYLQKRESTGTFSEPLLISTAYTLSGIYSCFEDQFSKIARVFENRIENPASWQKELLDRMQIEVPGVRPAVISRESFLLLDEMRGFRHIFRSSYRFELDEARLNLVLKRWQEGKDRVRQDVARFLGAIVE